MNALLRPTCVNGLRWRDGYCFAWFTVGVELDDEAMMSKLEIYFYKKYSRKSQTHFKLNFTVGSLFPSQSGGWLALSGFGRGGWDSLLTLSAGRKAEQKKSLTEKLWKRAENLLNLL